MSDTVAIIINSITFVVNVIILINMIKIHKKIRRLNNTYELMIRSRRIVDRYKSIYSGFNTSKEEDDKNDFNEREYSKEKEDSK